MQELNVLLEPKTAIELPLKDLTLVDERRLMYMGRNLVLSHQAYKNLIEVVGLDEKIVSKLNERLTENRDGGLIILNHLIQKINEDNNSVILVIESATITRIVDPVKKGLAIPAQTIVELLEYAISNSEYLELKEVVLSKDGTTASINVIDNRKVIIQIPGEDIQVGFTVEWDLFGPTIFRDYAIRQVCSNGMVGPVDKDFRWFDRNTSCETWQKAMMDDGRYSRMVAKYEQAVIKACQSLLSLKELESVSETVELYYKDNNSIVLDHIKTPMDLIELDYKRNGIETELLTVKQKANCPTPVCAWDAVNLLTYLASHPDEVVGGNNQYTNQEVKKIAGKLLFSTRDSDNWVENTPHYETPKLRNVGNLDFSIWEDVDNSSDYYEEE